MTDWRAMTDAEREALEPGTVGWKWKPGTFLRKGQFIEELREPKVLPNGAVITKIRRCSNGVGEPSLELIGSTKGVDVSKIEHKDGWYPMAPGAYRPFKPSQGLADFDGLKKYKRPDPPDKPEKTK